MTGHGEVVLLHREALRTVRGGQARGGHGRVPAPAAQDRDAQRLVRLPVGRIRDRGTGAQQDVLSGAEQQDGAGGAPPSEIADVGGAGDQGGGRSCGGAPVADQPAADGVHL